MAEKMEILERIRMEAMDAQRILRESAQKRSDEERTKDGLVLIKAIYGRLEEMDPLTDGINEETPDPDLLNYQITYDTGSTILDVTVPLQNLISESQLRLPAQSKSHLIGFFDPYLGERKHLRIVYRYGPQRSLHQVTLEDTSIVRIPLRSHIIQ